MTAGFRTYRFSRPSQWQRCLLHGFDVSEAAVTLTARLSPVAAPIGARAVVTAVAAGRDGRPLWRVSSGGRAYFVRLNEFDGAETTVDIDELLASGTRWIVDPRWLWTFAPGGIRTSALRARNAGTRSIENAPRIRFSTSRRMDGRASGCSRNLATEATSWFTLIAKGGRRGGCPFRPRRADPHKSEASTGADNSPSSPPKVAA